MLIEAKGQNACLLVDCMRELQNIINEMKDEQIKDPGAEVEKGDDTK